MKKLSISLTWRDQGWGGTKGDVFFGLIRGVLLKPGAGAGAGDAC